MKGRTHRRALGGYFALNGLGLACWVPRIPQIRTELGLNEAELGAILLCVAVGALIAMPTAGVLVDRWGARVLTPAAAAGYVAAIGCIALAGSGPALAVVLFFTGLCNGALDVAMNTLAEAEERSCGRPVLATFHGLFSLGTLAGAAVGTLAAAAGVSPGRQLLAVGACCLPAVAALAPLTPHHRAAATGGPRPDATPSGRPHLLWRLLPFGVMAFCVLLAEGAVADWTAVLLTDTRSASPGAAAGGYLAFTATMAAGRLAGDRVVARLGAAAALRGGAVATAAGLMLLLLTPGLFGAIAGCVLLGAGISCQFPLLIRHAALAGRRAPGRSVAAVSTVGYLGFLAGPPLIGFLAEATALRTALVALALAPVAVLLLAQHTRGATTARYGAAQRAEAPAEVSTGRR